MSSYDSHLLGSSAETAPIAISETPQKKKGGHFNRTPNSAGAAFGSLGRSGVRVSYNYSDEDDDDDINDDSEFDDASSMYSTQAERATQEQEELLKKARPHANYGGTSSGGSSSNNNNNSYGGTTTHARTREERRAVYKAFDAAVRKGEIQTTASTETKTILKYSAPLTMTFLMQYSLTVASVFSVGHLGKNELAACSLASMTSAITGFAVVHGVATCLDTLCAQAYGRKDYKMVGVHFLRCTIFLWIIAVPIILLWAVFGRQLLHLLLDDPELIHFAALYLEVLAFGFPAYILFENLKHYLQSQGDFNAGTYILLICAPINISLNYLLVWNEHFGLGYVGAPIAVVFTDWLMATMLSLYVVFINGRKCWCGFRPDNLFTGWGRMIRLAIPGIIMVEAEWLAFEIVTFAASRFGTDALACQSVLVSVCGIIYQIPFAIGIAASTRIANLVGANLTAAARISARMAAVISLVFGVLNMAFMLGLRDTIGKMFTNDEAVLQLVRETMPFAALFQVNDSLGVISGGILRAQGRQRIGGYLNLFFYYVVGLPAGVIFAFHWGYGIEGFWIGLTIGVFFVSILQLYFVWKSNWREIVKDALRDGKTQAAVTHA